MLSYTYKKATLTYLISLIQQTKHTVLLFLQQIMETWGGGAEYTTGVTVTGTPGTDGKNNHQCCTC